MQIPHLSSTQLSMYSRCGAAWFFRYVMLEKIPPKAVMARGRSFHQAIAHDLRQKATTQVNLPIDEVLDYFVQDFDEESRTVAWQENETPEQFKDSGVKMVERYTKEVVQHIRPLEVEQKFTLMLKDKDWVFTGRTDVIDEDGLMLDAKTTGQTPRSPKSDHIIQITAYSLGYKKRNDNLPPFSGARLDYTVATKEPRIVQFPVQITGERVRFFLNLLAITEAGIKNDIFMPVRSGLYCSPNGCGYWDLCHKEYGG